MNSTGGEHFALLIFILIAFTLYFIPSIIAFYRGHEYKFIIAVLNVVGGATGVLWIVALIWAIYPKNRTVADPLLGNATGIGNRNTGHLLGEIDYGRERGYLDARSSMKPQIRKNDFSEDIGKLDPTNMDILEKLEKLNKLKETGAISEEEFTKLKMTALKNMM